MIMPTLNLNFFSRVKILCLPLHGYGDQGAQCAPIFPVCPRLPSVPGIPIVAKAFIFAVQSKSPVSKLCLSYGFLGL